MTLPEVMSALDAVVDSGQAKKNDSGFYTPLSIHARHLLEHARSLGRDVEVHIKKMPDPKPTVESTMSRLNRAAAQASKSRPTNSGSPRRTAVHH